MNKEVKIQGPVANFIRAINGHDRAAFSSSFSADAIVDDAGREFRGAIAIIEWGDREIFEVNVTLDVIDATERDGRTILIVKADGNFDRTGLPDPVVFEQQFSFRDNKIISLRTQLASEKQ
jgi:hypothetical protein